ncbi:MAG: GNAT family N-acetyltransferase [Rhodospirillales bacterium]|nr:GNAT family N-acetyltransferase [Rhodospirillales bacterium]
MPDGREPVTIRVVSRIAEVPAAEWDACAGGANPFVGHAFLSALEESGSVTAETGWLPQHLTVADEHGRLIGCVPLYLKSHSYGEYVFDWSWADAYERAGGRYYPKLQSSVPFTPVTGPRLLLRPGAGQGAVAAALIAGMQELAERHGVASLHVTFPERAEWQALGEAGFLQRVGLQYHWQNRGYGSFEDFLGDLVSRKRKAIRKERRKVAESGVTLRALSGGDLKPQHWDAFHRFYLATADRKWGQPYLNREFFALLGERLAKQVVLVLAEQGGRPVAGALNLKGGGADGGGTLYGRNWGSLGRYRFLHFEACYYQAIDYAIRHGLAWVEAGAQGEHKIQRGYLPTETYSAHWIRDPGFRDAVEQFLEREREMLRHEMAALEEGGPFRKNEDGDRGPR